MVFGVILISFDTKEVKSNDNFNTKWMFIFIESRDLRELALLGKQSTWEIGKKIPHTKIKFFLVCIGSKNTI
jgi:hypothetical protein